MSQGWFGEQERGFGGRRKLDHIVKDAVKCLSRVRH
jgi:hypothetical protein